MADGNEGGKRSADGGGNYQNKRARGSYGGGNQIVIRMLIDSSTAGGVIGKGGENIKKLQEDHKCKINIPTCESTDRILKVISPELNNALECIRDLVPKVQKRDDRYGRDQNDGRPKKQFIRLLIHQSLVGPIIGQKGANIKEIRESTKTAIKVESDALPGSTERVVEIAGEPEAIQQAVEMIYNTCNKNEIKGPVKEYDPANAYYDQGGYGDYGEYDGYGGYGGGGYGGQSRGGYGGYDQGGYGDYGYDQGYGGNGDYGGYGGGGYGGGGYGGGASQGSRGGGRGAGGRGSGRGSGGRGGGGRGGRGRGGRGGGGY